MNITTALLKFIISVFFFSISIFAKAQLCSGSLGDPVVNITFDNGSGTSSQPKGYSFVSSSCPSDGNYTITSQTSNCFGNTWHTVTSDHTGGGSFMLVNASFDPGDFYVDTVDGLCPNTTYEFAAWIMNVLSRSGGGIQPNITFNIEKTDGSILATYQSGNINPAPTAFWKQYGFYFTTPASDARIVLRMTNNAPGGIGNDLALDDITFRPCGALVTADIVDHPEDTVHICEGEASNFDLTTGVSSDYVNPVYFWQSSLDSGKTWKDIPGASARTYTHQSSKIGAYWYRLTVVEATSAGLKVCRIASNVVAIVVHPPPVVDAGPDRTLIKGNSVFLAGNATGEQIKFTWSPDLFMDNAEILKPELTPDVDITYTLSATSKYGCFNKDSAFVKVVNGIFVPNAFTPNGDGKNDYWRVPFLDPSLAAEVSLFNRYGDLVYHASGNTISWDGKINGRLQPSGVYVYFIRFGTISFRGTVTLVR